MSAPPAAEGRWPTPISVLAPIDEARRRELEMALGTRPGVDTDGRWRRLFKSIPTIHFASLAILPGEDCNYLSLELTVDGPADDLFDDLIRTPGLVQRLQRAYACCVDYPAAQDAASLVSFLRGHSAAVGGFYAGCPGRTARQVRAERLLHRRMRGTLLRADAASAIMEPGAAVEIVRGAVKRNQARHRGFWAWAHSEPARPWLVRLNGTPSLYRIAGAVLLTGTFVFPAELAFLDSPWPAALQFTLRYEAALIALLAFGWTTARSLRRWLALRGACLINRRQDWPFAPGSPSLDLPEFGPGHCLNHMISVTEIRAPVFWRRQLLRVSLRAISLAGRVIFNHGLLGKTPNIHAARWVIFDRGRRVAFFSNYDGSWDSYLSDFVQFAVPGVNLAWMHTRLPGGAAPPWPPTFTPLAGGAADEVAFKAYARASHADTWVWYGAYPDLCTTEIDCNTSLRQGLARCYDAAPALAQAAAWCRLAA